MARTARQKAASRANLVKARAARRRIGRVIARQGDTPLNVLMGEVRGLKGYRGKFGRRRAAINATARRGGVSPLLVSRGSRMQRKAALKRPYMQFPDRKPKYRSGTGVGRHRALKGTLKHTRRRSR